jgi:hypothetical protein
VGANKHDRSQARPRGSHKNISRPINNYTHMIWFNIWIARIATIIALTLIAILCCVEIIWELLKAPFTKNKNNKNYYYDDDGE